MNDRLDGELVDSLWDFSDPAGTAERMRATVLPGPVANGELQTQLARALGLADRGDEADAVLDAIDPAAAPVRIRLALERGRRANSSGRPADAVPMFVAALELAEAEGEDFLAADAAHMLAIADQANAVAWAARGIAIVKVSRDARTQRWAIALHNNLGWLHHDAGRYDEALIEFQRADAAARVHGTEEQQQIAQWAIARCLRSLGRRAEALAIQQQLARLRPDDEYVIEELALLTER